MKPRGPSGGRPRELNAPGEAGDWRDHGQCHGVEMTPDSTDYDGAEWAGVRAVCRGCPVTTQCLAAAMAAEGSRVTGRFGMWGGMDPQQRTNLLRSQQRVARLAPEPKSDPGPGPKPIGKP